VRILQDTDGAPAIPRDEITTLPSDPLLPALPKL